MGHDAIPRLDASNLAGITTLMNQNMVKQDIQLDHAEADVMGRKQPKKHHDVDPIKLYDQEMNKLAEEIGIDLEEDQQSHKPSKTPYDIESYNPGRHERRHDHKDRHSS